MKNKIAEVVLIGNIKDVECIAPKESETFFGIKTLGDF